MKCSQCGSSPAKFTLGADPVCASDYARFAHSENTLRVAEEEVQSIAPAGVHYGLIERPDTSDGKGRYALTGPDDLVISDSLDALIVQAEAWASSKANV